MKLFALTVLALVVGAVVAFQPSTTAAQPVEQTEAAGLMDSVAIVNGCVVTRDGSVVRLSSPTPARSLVQTSAKFSPPFTVKLRAATDSTNLRLYYNAGMVIFNWECRRNELRVHDPLTDRTKALPGMGYIEPGQMHDIVWDVKPDGMSISVDGEERLSLPGNYGNIDAPIGIGQAFSSVVSIESFEVTSP